jgi:hypothetical protein
MSQKPQKEYFYNIYTGKMICREYNSVGKAIVSEVTDKDKVLEILMGFNSN